MSWVCIDADDVTVDFVGLVCAVVSRDFDVQPPVTKEDVTSWNFGQFLDQYIGKDWWEWWESRAVLWGTKAKPIPGALGGIEKLRRDGHRLELLTSKPPWAEQAMYVWLGRYAPQVHQVTMVPLGGDKTKWTQGDILIDDRDKNVTEWVQSRGDRVALLFDAPHNREFAERVESELPRALPRTLTDYQINRILPVKDWHEVLERIGEMSG